MVFPQKSARDPSLALRMTKPLAVILSASEGSLRSSGQDRLRREEGDRKGSPLLYTMRLQELLLDERPGVV